jgi:putative membrane-bound dehydrogenase-like protein
MPAASRLRSVLAVCTTATFPLLVLLATSLPAQHVLRPFTRQQLEARFLCEGATAADFDRDGDVDVTAGPFWWEGPDFTKVHTLYAPTVYDKAGYSDHFFSFAHDFDGDGWLDLLRIGFPGKQAIWYRNPKGPAEAWQAHVVFDGVDNESPTFTDLTGDGKPELVCMFQDRLGYATVDWTHPERPWTWHAISATGIGGRFTHGLGVGDIDGDGKADVLWKHGWWQQPASLDGDPQWRNHGVKFCEPGGAQMLVYDVDGDGDNDVVTSEHAHGFGLVWHEQKKQDGAITFVRHRILGKQADENPFGVVLGGLHALCAADMDRDGVLDVVTGNRYWAHAGNDPVDREPARLMWLRCQRGAGGVQWIPHEIDAHSGVGTQVVATDVNGDGAPDVVVGNKMGVFVHTQRPAPGTPRAVDAAQRIELARLLQDRAPQRGGSLPKGKDGKPLNLDLETGDLRDWTATGDAFPRVETGDSVAARRDDMQSGHTGRHWIGSYEPERSDRPRGTLTSAPFVLEAPHVSFLVGGGRDPKTRVEIVRVDDQKVLFTASGTDNERLHLATADLTAFQGNTVCVRLVDDATGHWGHINFDDFRLHGSSPKDGGFPANEALARMSLPKGFHAELFAAEPDVTQPIAMAVDEAGRLWVVEAHSYPQKRPEGQGLDRIVVFTDADGDGRFDQRTQFLAGLNLTSGIAVGFGGVFVGQAPNLLFVPDRNHDLVPDGPPEALLDGWHWEDTHETLNAFRWGPDGWLYGCHGVFTHSLVGKPGAPESERQPLNAAVWRYHPTQQTFEVFAHGTSNPWGVDFDEHGQAFVTACVIPHLFHMIQGAVYDRQAGNHFSPFVYADIETIADHRHWQGNQPHSGNGVSDQQGGGHAHCAALLYRGGRWPQQYDGGLLMVNLHGHRLNHDVLTRQGSGFVGSHGPDFLRSNDQSFLGTALAHAPDGNVYLLDWYDDQTCHHSKIEAWDRSNGRIYKLCYGTQKESPRDLGALADGELVPLLFAANEYTATTARRLLQERRAIAVAPAVLAELNRADLAEPQRLRALWALHTLGSLSDRELGERLGDRHEYVRAFAIQFLVEDRKATPEQVAAFARLAQTDPSPVVRLYLAAAMQRLPLADRWTIATALAAHAEDSDDHNLPKMVWFGIEPALPTDPSKALQFARDARLPNLAAFTIRRLTEAGGAALDAVIAALAASPDARTAMPWLDALVKGLERHTSMPCPKSWLELAAAAGRWQDAKASASLAIAGAVFADPPSLATLRTLVADQTQPRARRERAFELLTRKPGPADRDAVLALASDPVLGDRAVRALPRFDDATVAKALLERWSTLPNERRPAAAKALATRADWASAMLDGVGDGRVDRGLLDAPLRQQLAQLGDEKVQQRLAAVWGRTNAASATATQQIEAWKGKLSAEVLRQADVTLGRAVYHRTCGACHQLYGQGLTFGPDLTGSNRKDLDYLLGNIIDPNREVALDYQQTKVKLKSGAVLLGLLTDETASAVTVKSQSGSEVVAKADIDGIERLDVSLMPPSQLDGLKFEEARDLIAYLQHDRQVPLRPGKRDGDLLFTGSSFALWHVDPAIWSIEDGEIVGRTTTGLPKNDFAISHLLLADFEFEFEVKLVGDQGNSGVQFRSEARNEGKDMAGPQADIGPGWWGKLYEEHGRGLLETAGGEQHVKKGDWNTYRIVAEGTRVQGWINGQACFDRDDPQLSRQGLIALQLHSGGPTEIRFRNLRLTVR